MQSPRVDWESSGSSAASIQATTAHRGKLTPFLPAENKAAFKRFLLGALTPSVLEAWIAEAEQIEYLEMEANIILTSLEYILSVAREP